MQLHNFAPDTRRDQTLEQIESRALSPKDTAREMRRAADREVGLAIGDIETVRGELQKIGGDTATENELDAALAELNASFDALDDELKENERVFIPAPAKSGIMKKPESSTKKEASVKDRVRSLLSENLKSGTVSSDLIELIQTPESEGHDAFAVEVGDAFLELAQTNRVNFKALDTLCVLAERAPAAGEEVLKEVQSYIGPIFAERILRDASFRKELQDMQTILSGDMAGLAICKETTISQLVLAKEIFGSGEQIIRAIEAMELSRYNDALKVETNYRDTILNILHPTIMEDGSLNGTLISQFQYEDHTYVDAEGNEMMDDTPGITRIFGIEHHTDEQGQQTTERWAKLDIIQLPKGLQRTGTGSRELAATDNVLVEAGFDSHKLEANIDKGGYVWGVKKFLWDIKTMRDTLKEDPNATEADVIGHFIDLQRSVMEENLVATGIDLHDPNIAASLAELDELRQYPLAVTPARLNEIGKDGPKFVIMKEEPSPRRGKTLRLAAPGETGEHFGKILTLGSRWFGKRKPSATA